MDVVPPGKIRWQYDPFSADESADEVDRKIYGRGDAADMKGGLIALVFAMLELKDAGVELNEDVKLLRTAGEETRAVGSGRLYQDGYMDGVDTLLVGSPPPETS
ncbi:MAG: M20/M25/M40 family metallo-hydrolase [Firmicutes bacterium]|nr:M20/M25/M40 family metallo-hydrolase [Bacillota bacterium]